MNILVYMILGVIGGPLLLLALAYGLAFPLYVLGAVAVIVGVPVCMGIADGLSIASEAKRPEPAAEREARADKKARDLLRP